MKAKTIHESDGQKTYAIIMDSGDETMRCIQDFATEQQLKTAQLTAIGAFSKAVIGYFDFSRKDYIKIPVEEQVEVLVMAGGISFDQAERIVHVHVVLGFRDGTTKGGHLIEGYVRPTLEIILTESPASLYRKYDPDTGLSLIDISK